MERNLKDRLLQESQYDPSAKEEIWARLEVRLEAEQDRAEPANRAKEPGTGGRRRGATRPLKIAMAVAAGFIAIGIFLALPAGTAFMKDIKSWLVPEKKVEVQIEGEKEQTDQKLHKNEESRYAIYYDQERYKLVQQNGKDVITTKEPLPERYPEVSLTIEQFKGVKPEELIKRMSGELSGKYEDVREVKKVSEPVEGYQVRALGGKDWNSEVIVIYVTDNLKQGSFALTEKFFLEASEGHGARFEQMLKEFRIIEE